MGPLRKNTYWQVVGTNYQFEITDLWGKGFKNNYTITAFELKFKHIKQIQIRSAEVLIRQLKEETIKQIHI